MRTDDLIRSGRVVAAAAAFFSIAACAARSGSPVPAGPAGSSVQPASADERTIAHVLNRLTFGPRPGDVEAVRRIGVAAFVDRQLYPERIDDDRLDARLATMPTLAASPHAIAEEYVKPAEMERKRRQAELAAGVPKPPPEPEAFTRERQVLAELSAQKILRAVYSERQLQEVLVDFWFNHFNVFVGKGADRLYVGDYERSVIQPRVFGRFRDLLGAVAQSPAMLFYLDNWLSTDPNGVHPARPVRAPSGMAARRPAGLPPRPGAARAGLNENYARELMELHTLGVDGGYTQRDVTEVARCFTGWTIAGPNDGGAFTFDPRRHDEGQKMVLGHVIKAGGGRSDGEQVLDILASHPATARFISTKLVRRFVADNPPPSLVDRAAARFRETGGDLREVVRTIITSREFAADQSRASKIKTPLEFVVSALRTTDARIDNPAQTVNSLRSLGMPVYGCQPPTGYPDRADAWVSAGSLLARMNFATALVSNRLPGVVVDLTALAGSTDAGVARQRLARLLVGPDESGTTDAVLARESRIPDMAALALGSPEFQRR